MGHTPQQWHQVCPKSPPHIATWSYFFECYTSKILQITYALKLKLKYLPGYSIKTITHSAISFWFYLDSLSRPSLFYVVTKYKSQLLFFCVCDLGKRKKKYSSSENTFNFNSNNLPKNMTFFQGSLGQHSYFFSAYLFTPVKQ